MALPVWEGYLLICCLPGPFVPSPLLSHGSSPGFLWKWITLCQKSRSWAKKAYPTATSLGSFPREFPAGSHYLWVILHLLTHREFLFLFLFLLQWPFSNCVSGLCHFKEEICSLNSCCGNKNIVVPSAGAVAQRGSRRGVFLSDSHAGVPLSGPCHVWSRRTGPWKAGAECAWLCPSLSPLIWLTWHCATTALCPSVKPGSWFFPFSFFE